MPPAVLVQIGLVLCLKADPSICREKPIVLEQPPTLMECMIWGQQAGADWLNKNPAVAAQFYLRKVTCSSNKADTPV